MSFKLPNFAPNPGKSGSMWCDIPLGFSMGIDFKGDRILKQTSWDTGLNPHALLLREKDEESVIQKNIISHCMQHPEEWEFYGINLEGPELWLYTNSHSIIKRVGGNIDGSLTILWIAKETIEKRNRQMKDSKVKYFRHLDDPPKAIMLMINEVDDIPTLSEERLGIEVCQIIEYILKWGRIAGVHLIVGTKGNSTRRAFLSELQQKINCKIVSGTTDLANSMMILNNESAANLPDVKDRGYIQRFGFGEQFQGYAASSE